MKNKSRILAAGSALLLMAGIAISQEAGMGGHAGMGPGHPGGEFGGHELAFFTKALDLTDAQQTQIKQIIAAEKPTLQPLMQQEKQSHDQMMQLVTGSATFDEAKAQAIATQEAQTHTQLEVEHARMMSQAYQILTPDQKTKFAQMQAKHQARMAEHMQHEQTEEAPKQ